MIAASEPLSTTQSEDQQDLARASDDTATDRTKCRLLSLPPELHNQIYELVVAGRETILVTWSPWHDGPYPEFWSEPAILRTCHQVRNEALPLFYAKSTFRFDCFKLFTRPQAIHVHAERMKHVQLLVVGWLVFDIDLKSNEGKYGLLCFQMNCGSSRPPESLSTDEFRRLSAVKAVLSKVGTNNKARPTSSAIEHLLETCQSLD